MRYNTPPQYGPIMCGQIKNNVKKYFFDINICLFFILSVHLEQPLNIPFIQPLLGVITI